ncbi:TetR/AcrR family transcriptional regulator [Frankia sp. EAN1pec]|uniref:TetR family transcriptional regulator n=1 Tax=Parafrankia sp. (strain EAN1pec) TaxID=298653 RepID=UPI0012F9B23C
MPQTAKNRPPSRHQAADAPAQTRLNRRKARTRQALIDAAKTFLAKQGSTADVSILEITEAADVGFGSFYNHFGSKTELFHAAIDDVLEEHGRMLDKCAAGLDDPAEVFAVSVRLTGRLVPTHPQMARILTQTGLSYLDSDRGLAPRALHDVRCAIEAGRFKVANPYVALATAGGSLLAFLHIWLAHPDKVDDAACDELAEQILRMFGMPPRTARAIAHRPLPTAPSSAGSA